MTRDELNALLRPHPPGTPMTDHLLDALAEHLMSDTKCTPAERAAWKVMLMNAMKIVETLHEIQPQESEILPNPYWMYTGEPQYLCRFVVGGKRFLCGYDDVTKTRITEHSAGTVEEAVKKGYRLPGVDDPSMYKDAKRYSFLREQHRADDPVCHLVWKSYSGGWENAIDLDAQVDRQGMK